MLEETQTPQEAAAELPEATESMNGPNKLGERDLNPKPINPKRLSKRAGAVFMFAGVGLIVLLFVGIMSRSQKMQQEANAPKTGNVAPASRAAETLANDLLNKKQRDDARRKEANDAGPNELPGGPGTAGASGSSSVDNLSATGAATPPLKLTRIGGAAGGNGRVPDLNQAGGLSQSPAGSGSLSGRKSAEELVREQQYKEEMTARKAPTSASQHGTNSGGLGGPLAGLIGGASTSGSVLQALLAHAAGASQGQSPIQQALAAVAVPGNGDADQNMQDRKNAFLGESGPKDVYLHATRQPQLSPYEIKAGWDIPAALMQSINTDVPGQIKGQVRENVYDTATGRYLLIPAGSYVIGTYDSHIAYGQTRVQAQWTRLIYPDGSSIALGGMIGQDAQGMAGFRDKVNNHYVRLASMGLLTSAFAAGIGIAANQGQSAGAYGMSNSQIASQALGQQMGQLGMEVTRRNMNVQPTITIPIGYRFNVRVNKDIVFEGPYEPK